MTLASLMNGVARRIAAWPMRLVSPSVRVEAIESLVNQQIAETEIPNGRLRFFAPTPLLRSRADGLMTKEPDMVSWLGELPESAVLWDVGANVGVFSLFAAVSRRCTVLSFEPSAANYYVLTRNVQLNKVERKVSTYCLALASRSTLGVLNLDSAALGGSMSQFGASGERSRYSSATEPLSHGMIGLSVDDFVRHYAPPFPTHLKMDVDGLELDILEGAKATLSDRRLRSAMIELSVSNAAERERAIALMTGAGFRLVSQGLTQGHADEYAANHRFERTA
jgi:FkbM family methyltransferase